ncbi:hypothetical protein PQ689_03170 [Thermoanaerobacterium thermosaccharolyticum]
MLTLEEAINLHEKGYAVTYDPDKQQITVEQETKMPLDTYTSDAN